MIRGQLYISIKHDAKHNLKTMMKTENNIVYKYPCPFNIANRGTDIFKFYTIVLKVFLFGMSVPPSIFLWAEEIRHIHIFICWREEKDHSYKLNGQVKTGECFAQGALAETRRR